MNPSMINDVEKRIWLDKVGLFKVHKNHGSGSCLFRSICHALGEVETDGESSRVRRQVVKHMEDKMWRILKRDKLFDYWRCRLMDVQHFTDDYLSLNKMEEEVKAFYLKTMSQDSEFGTIWELRAAADLYKFHFDVIRESSSVVIPPTSLSHSNRHDDDDCNDFACNCHDYDYNCATDDGDCYDHENSCSAFEIYSCRNKGRLECGEIVCSAPCQNPRLFFLSTGRQRGHGHWEYLEALYLAVEQTPLNRRIFGEIYMERVNKSHLGVLEDLKNHPIVGRIKKSVADKEDWIVQDDPFWPVDISEDYAGCGNKYLMHSHDHLHQRDNLNSFSSRNNTNYSMLGNQEEGQQEQISRTRLSMSKFMFIPNFLAKFKSINRVTICPGRQMKNNNEESPSSFPLNLVNCSSDKLEDVEKCIVNKERRRKKPIMYFGQIWCQNKNKGQPQSYFLG